jgi:hypothetical protein
VTKPNLWHGYPQALDAHPDRPWWRRPDGLGWERTDGRRPLDLLDAKEHSRSLLPEEREALRAAMNAPRPTTSMTWFPAELAAIDLACEEACLSWTDRACPLPCPPPACGQVWRWASGRTAVVVAVDGDRVWFGTGATIAVADWPPADVCVAGPGAPWSPLAGGGTA